MDEQELQREYDLYQEWLDVKESHELQSYHQYLEQAVSELRSTVQDVKGLMNEHRFSCGDGCYEKDKCFLCLVIALMENGNA